MASQRPSAMLDVEGDKVGAKRDKRRGSAICGDRCKYLLLMYRSRRKNRTLIRLVSVLPQ